MVNNTVFVQKFDNWLKRFILFVSAKGKVEPGRFRAAGFQPPAHRMADVKDGIRYFRMMAGIPARGSSPQVQQEQGLNRDKTFTPRKGEGEKLPTKEKSKSEMKDLIQQTFDYRGVPILVAVFASLFVLEGFFPLRKRKVKRMTRAMANGIFSIPGFIALRLVFLPATIWLAWMNQEHWQFGLMHWLDYSPWVESLLAFFWLDYTIYLWHALNHRISFLWRFHIVHHTDVDLDLTTALRFHAGELFGSVIFRGAGALIAGASPVLVLIYEIVFEAATEFHHSNLRLPVNFESILNKVIVTPRMHGIHHSIIRQETDSNYSVIFSFWDRIHRTLTLHIPQHEITIGVPSYQDHGELTFFYLLKLPFRRQREWKVDQRARSLSKRDEMLP